ncbi:MULTISPECIES: LuxR C-terminal-related transcriptional regulator [unclassified Sinorhizobium]|uniref:LuxR C-terminal-related transcriptional regulator n=1 Tax=unclassified Sinorhizobium TaxID=2613772 RepID=UPI0035249FFE
MIECPLTERQLRVVSKLATGAPAKTVAGDLNMTLASVHNDIQRALQKIPAGNSVGLVAFAIRKGWI